MTRTALILFAPIAFVSSVCAAPEPTQTLNGTPIETAQVNENGERHDTSLTECIDAPAGRLFEQGSVVARIVSEQDSSERSCSLSFANYQEFVPGIKEPTRACLTSFVKSKGGIANYHSRGHLTCAADYRLRPADEGVQPVPPGPRLHDTTSVIPGLPADALQERDSRSLVRISVPLRSLQFAIDDGIKNNQSQLPGGFSLTLMSSGFRDYAVDSTALKYFVDIDVSGPIGARCQVWVGFAIPPATPDQLLVQSLGTTVDCKTGSLLGQLAGLPEKISESVRKAVSDGLGKKLAQNNDTFADWQKTDPDWAAVMLKAVAQGSYCNWRTEPGLCVAAGWRRRTEFNDRETQLLAQVPVGEGPVDRQALAVKLARYESVAQRTRMATANGVKFPAGFSDDGSLDDGDMALFGGLLCRSKSDDGCQLLRDAYTADGRFWRSPRRVNEADTKEHASFSGDQLRGVLHYFIATGDKDKLRAFLRYLKKQTTAVPDATVPLISGYSSCPTRFPNFTCLLSGDDWYALALLAKKYGMESELPADFADIQKTYGMDYEAMLWQALVTSNAGYRLHLVANSAWILRSLGETDARIDRTIRLLNARQPQNPFFAYLLFGADKRVERLADAKCLPPDQARSAFVDWTWQRADSDDRWKVGMVWDCVFIYGLLARGP